MNCPVCGNQYIDEQTVVPDDRINRYYTVRTCGQHSWQKPFENQVNTKPIRSSYSVDGLFKPLQDTKEYTKRRI